MRPLNCLPLQLCGAVHELKGSQAQWAFTGQEIFSGAQNKLSLSQMAGFLHSICILFPSPSHRFMCTLGPMAHSSAQATSHHQPQPLPCTTRDGNGMAAALQPLLSRPQPPLLFPCQPLPLPASILTAQRQQREGERNYLLYAC